MTGPNLAQLEAECATFNAAVAIGDQVAVRLDDGTTKLTTTRTAAQVLSGHTAVVWLDGITGCYLLSRVSRLLGAAA